MRGTGNGNVKRENSNSSSESKSVGTQSGGSGFSSSPDNNSADIDMAAVFAMIDEHAANKQARDARIEDNNRVIAECKSKKAELRMQYLQDVGDVLAKEGRRAEKIAVKEDANLQKATKHFENVTGGHADKVQSRKKKEAGCIIL